MCRCSQEPLGVTHTHKSEILFESTDLLLSWKGGVVGTRIFSFSLLYSKFVPPFLQLQMVYSLNFAVVFTLFSVGVFFHGSNLVVHWTMDFLLLLAGVTKKKTDRTGLTKCEFHHDQNLRRNLSRYLGNSADPPKVFKLVNFSLMKC